MPLFLPSVTASSVGYGNTTLVLSNVLLLLLLPLAIFLFSPLGPRCFRKALRTLFVHTERTYRRVLLNILYHLNILYLLNILYTAFLINLTLITFFSLSFWDWLRLIVKSL